MIDAGGQATKSGALRALQAERCRCDMALAESALRLQYASPGFAASDADGEYLYALASPDAATMP